MSTQYPSLNLQQEDILNIPLPKEPWIDPKTVNKIPAPSQFEDTNQAMSMPDQSSMTASNKDTKENPSEDHSEDITESIQPVQESTWMAPEIMTLTSETNPVMPFPETSWVPASTVDANKIPLANEINSTIPIPEASWLASDIQNTVATDTTSSNQPGELNQMTEISWMAHTIVDANEAPVINQQVEMNPTMSVAQIVAPSNQPEGLHLILPNTDGSWVAQEVVDVNQPVQWGIVAMMYPTQNELTETDQSEPRVESLDDQSMMPVEPTVVSSERNWEVHSYIRASQDSLNEPQTADEQPIEYASASPGPLTIDENVEPEYQEDDSTIAIPLITDPNVTPELVTFRPGVYEGDAIPPVYSNLSIIDASSDYEPPVPSAVYSNLSIIPEPVPDYQIITEPVISEDEIIIGEEEVTEIAHRNNGDHPTADEVTTEQESLAAVPRPATNSGYRGVDAMLLATLRHAKLILIYQDFHFSRYFRQGLKIRWQCVNRSCNAFLYSLGNKITATYAVHNHLSIISKNTKTVKVQNSKSNDVYSLEEDISAMTDPVLSLNDDNGPNTIKLYNHSSPPNEALSQEAYNSTQIIATGDNPFYNNVTHLLLASGNTIIPHDPSLEITLKSPSVQTESVDDDVTTCIITTLTSVPDPLGICVTTYTPPISKETECQPDLIISRCSGPAQRTNYNHMTVPKDVQVKVTITSEPLISEPQVYYDGKYVTHTTKQNRIVTDTPTNAANAYTDFSQSTLTKRQVAPTFTKSNNERIFTNTTAVRTTTFSNTPSTSTSIVTPRLTDIPNLIRRHRDRVASRAPITKPTITRAASIVNTRRVTDASTSTNSPVISIQRSQIVSDSDPQYTDLYNAFIPRAQMQPNQHVAPNEQRVTQDNLSSYNLGMNRAVQPNYHRVPRMPSPRFWIPRTMTSSECINRRSIRFARARIVQSRQQNTKE